jgi:hypothetical protein
MSAVYHLSPRYSLWPVEMPAIDVLGKYDVQELFCPQPQFIIDHLDNKVYDGMSIYLKDMFCREVDRVVMGEYVGDWNGHNVRFKRE